jgi:hypothetical protein
MEFTFETRTRKRFTVRAKTAKQGAQLAAWKLWQNQPDDKPKPQSHVEITVTEPGPGEDDNAPGEYGVTYKAPGETGAYTRATVLKMKF